MRRPPINRLLASLPVSAGAPLCETSIGTSSEPVKVPQAPPGVVDDASSVREILAAAGLAPEVHVHTALIDQVNELYRAVLDRSIELDEYDTSVLDEICEGLVLMEESLKSHEKRNK